MQSHCTSVYNYFNSNLLAVRQRQQHQAMSQYSEEELKEYSQCPQLLYAGGHKGGLPSCPFCAEIYRRYHPQVATEEQVCTCCDGNPASCYEQACLKAGFCIMCTETVDEDEVDKF